jgi:hypothetical protein
MSLENAELAFKHAARQDGEAQIDVLFEGLMELMGGLSEEIASLRARLDALEAKAGT